MNKIRCWDCKYLARCEKVSGKINECSDYRLYNYNNKRNLTENDFEKLTGKSKRTMYRHLQQAKELLNELEELTGVRFCLKKSKVDNLFHLTEVDVYED